MLFMGVANYQKFCKLVENGRGKKRCCMKRHIIEFSVKSGKHGTRTLSLVQNRVRFLKTWKRSILASNRGWNSEMHPFFCGKLSFILFWPPLPLFLSASTAAAYIFIAPTCTTIIISSNPDLVKFPYLANLSQRGDKGWKEAQRQGEDRVTLRKTLCVCIFIAKIFEMKRGRFRQHKQKDRHHYVYYTDGWLSVFIKKYNYLSVSKFQPCDDYIYVVHFIRVNTVIIIIKYSFT
jgi:hypothetical protein